MVELNQTASGVSKPTIQRDAPSPVSRHEGPDDEEAIASVIMAPIGNAEAPLGDVAQATQNGNGVKNAAAEKEGQAALRQDNGASFGDMNGSSPGANGPARPAVQGTENGLHQQIIAHDSTSQGLAYLVTGAFFALIILLMFSTAMIGKDKIDSGVKDLLFTLLGVVGASWANIIGFYFGSSAGSAQQSHTISSALLLSKPTQAPTAQQSQAISAAVLHGNSAQAPAVS
jgi:hypothetical protein